MSMFIKENLRNNWHNKSLNNNEKNIPAYCRDPVVCRGVNRRSNRGQDLWLEAFGQVVAERTPDNCK